MACDDWRVVLLSIGTTLGREFVPRTGNRQPSNRDIIASLLLNFEFDFVPEPNSEKSNRATAPSGTYAPASLDLDAMCIRIMPAGLGSIRFG